jgi:hypothetical protein
VVILTAIPLAFSAVTTGGMFQTFARDGGRSVWSDGVYDLERYLSREHAAKPVMAVDWGLAANLVTQSQGRLHVDEVAYTLEFPESSSQPSEVLSRPLRDSRTWYLLRSPEATAFPRARQRFFRAARQLRVRPVLLRTLPDRKGRPLYELYALRRGRSERGRS